MPGWGGPIQIGMEWSVVSGESELPMLIDGMLDLELLLLF